MEIRELKGPEPRRRFPWETSPKVLAEAERTAQSAMTEIGRASCRERV